MKIIGLVLLIFIIVAVVFTVLCCCKLNSKISQEEEIKRKGE